jgi:hypothetical protein
MDMRVDEAGHDEPVVSVDDDVRMYGKRPDVLGLSDLYETTVFDVDRGGLEEAGSVIKGGDGGVSYEDTPSQFTSRRSDHTLLSVLRPSSPGHLQDPLEPERV